MGMFLKFDRSECSECSEKLQLTNETNSINGDWINLKTIIERLNEKYIQLAKSAEEKNDCSTGFFL